MAWLSVADNTFLTLIKIITEVLTGSVSVLSEAVHSAIDLLAVGVPAVLPVSEAHLIARHIEADIRELFTKGAEIDVHVEPCDENYQSCHQICPKKI